MVQPDGKLLAKFSQANLAEFLAAMQLFVYGGAITVLVLSMIGLGFFKGMYESNIWASLYDVVRPECRATAVGV